MGSTDEPITRADHFILEFLEKCDAVLTPKCIAPNIGPPDGYNQKYVGQRCRQLEDWGLLSRTDRGMYHITDQGQAYLDGRFDASTLSEDT